MNHIHSRWCISITIYPLRMLYFINSLTQLWNTNPNLLGFKIYHFLVHQRHWKFYLMSWRWLCWFTLQKYWQGNILTNVCIHFFIFVTWILLLYASHTFQRYAWAQINKQDAIKYKLCELSKQSWLVATSNIWN